MLHCSPLLVTYAMILLLLTYVYCLDLTESELPQFLNDTSTLYLKQIGLEKVSTDRSAPIFIKVRCRPFSSRAIEFQHILNNKTHSQKIPKTMFKKYGLFFLLAFNFEPFATSLRLNEILKGP